MYFFIYFFNTIFVSSQKNLENPEGARVIIGFISDVKPRDLALAVEAEILVSASLVLASALLSKIFEIKTIF